MRTGSSHLWPDEGQDWDLCAIFELVNVSNIKNKKYKEVKVEFTSALLGWVVYRAFLRTQENPAFLVVFDPSRRSSVVLPL